MYNCKGCTHSVTLPTNPQNIGQKSQMECRRYPPQVIALPVQTLQGSVFAPAAAFPVVSDAQYCGEFRPAPAQGT